MERLKIVEDKAEDEAWRRVKEQHEKAELEADEAAAFKAIAASSGKFGAEAKKKVKRKKEKVELDKLVEEA